MKEQNMFSRTLKANNIIPKHTALDGLKYEPAENSKPENQTERHSKERNMLNHLKSFIPGTNCDCAMPFLGISRTNTWPAACWQYRNCSKENENTMEPKNYHCTSFWITGVPTRLKIVSVSPHGSWFQTFLNSGAVPKPIILSCWGNTRAEDESNTEKDNSGWRTPIRCRWRFQVFIIFSGWNEFRFDSW